MAESERIAMLSEILKQNPDDAFARYGLAMEYSSEGDLNSSLTHFDTLLTAHPEYTPGYFMCAQTLLKAGRVDAARVRLEQGIASAEKSGNVHARNEMQAVLETLD